MKQDASERIGRWIMATRISIGWLLTVGLTLGSGPLNAQQAVSEVGPRHGGFGAPVVKLTEVDSRFGVFMGGRGGWVIDGSVVIGGGGYALVNTGNFDDLTNGAGDPGGLEMAYGGLELGYVHHPENRVHVSVGLLLGAGGLTWTPDDSSENQADDGFFIAEPELDLILNATTFFRAAIGVSYRLVQDAELFELRDGDLSGLTGVLSLQFGSF